MTSKQTKKIRSPGAVTFSRSASFSLEAWLPAFVGMLTICCESTRTMGADHTMVWISHLCSPIMRITTLDLPELNHVLRKSGHFFGYGFLGLAFARAWLSLLFLHLHHTWTRLRLNAGGLGVCSAALIATFDEVHQSFLPNRTASPYDVLLDASGALLLVLLTTLPVLLRRRRALARVTEARSYRTWLAGIYRFEHALHQGRPLA